MEGPRCLIIAGPTASGKSALALEIAERFGGEIVNADSRQVYRFMDVGTAKPSAADRRRVPHHLFDVVTPAEPFDAACYHQFARAAVREISARGRLPVVVGGTGLYIRVLIRGLFRGPSAIPRLRWWLGQREEAAPGILYRWCRRLDPPIAERIHPNDRVRLVRALEVALATGERMSAHQERHGYGDRLGTVLYLVVDPGAESLKRRIRRRSADLFEGGLVDEVRSLWERGFGPDLAPMRSIGYVEAGRVLRCQSSVANAIDDLVRSTERFAKRQRTWFRSESDAAWVSPGTDRTAILEGVRRLVEAPARASL
jgi:tRNA dimethylallyltransferase